MKIAKQYFISFGILIVLLSSFVILGAHLVSAQTLWNMQQGKQQIGDAFGQKASSPTDIRKFVVLLIKTVLTFVALIMTALIIYAGAKWMTAGGNQEQIGEAKNRIKNAAIGMAIILASYMIMDFVARCVLEAIDGSGIWGC